MMQKVLAIFVLLGILTVPLDAAYTTATVTQNADLTSDGKVHVSVRFTGNAGEAAIVKDFAGVSAIDLQTQVALYLQQLNQAKTDAAIITAGLTLTPPTSSGISPASGAMNVSTTPTLSWSVPGSATYDVALSTVNPPTNIVATGLTVSQFTPASPLTVSTVYFWRVRATDSAGTVRTSPVFSFTTAAAPSGEPKFFADLARFYGVDAAVKAGIVSAADANYLALKALVISEFNTVFVNDDGWPR